MFLVCAFLMTHFLQHGIDVEAYIDRNGIAVLGARPWATQFILLARIVKPLLELQHDHPLLSNRVATDTKGKKFDVCFLRR